MIPNKRGRMPVVEGIHLQTLAPIGISLDEIGEWTVGCTSPRREADWVRSVLSGSGGAMIIPAPERPPEPLMSRFLGKVAMEVLTFRCLDRPAALAEVYSNPDLVALRMYTRRGAGGRAWPFHERRIYPSESEVIHEFMLLRTEQHELYLILAVFGLEYAFNLGGPELDGYVAWLETHGWRSPLYMDGVSWTTQPRC